MIRPLTCARPAGLDSMPWLFTASFALTLLVSPLAATFLSRPNVSRQGASLQRS